MSIKPLENSWRAACHGSSIDARRPGAVPAVVGLPLACSLPAAAPAPGSFLSAPAQLHAAAKLLWAGRGGSAVRTCRGVRVRVCPGGDRQPWVRGVYPELWQSIVCLAMPHLTGGSYRLLGQGSSEPGGALRPAQQLRFWVSCGFHMELSWTRKVHGRKTNAGNGTTSRRSQGNDPSITSLQKWVMREKGFETSPNRQSTWGKDLLLS